MEKYFYCALGIFPLLGIGIIFLLRSKKQLGKNIKKDSDRDNEKGIKDFFKK